MSTIADEVINQLGGPTEAGRRLSAHFPGRKPLTGAAVWMWKKRGMVPAEYCIAIERELGGEVTRSDMRPDIYPPEEYAA